MTETLTGAGAPQIQNADWVQAAVRLPATTNISDTGNLPRLSLTLPKNLDRRRIYCAVLDPTAVDGPNVNLLWSGQLSFFLAGQKVYTAPCSRHENQIPGMSTTRPSVRFGVEARNVTALANPTYPGIQPARANSIIVTSHNSIFNQATEWLVLPWNLEITADRVEFGLRNYYNITEEKPVQFLGCYSEAPR